MNYELTLKSNNILTIDELKLLGVTIDNKLTFSSHIKLVLSKIHAKIAALRRIRNFIDSNTAVKLYKSYILPHFDYCSSLLPIGINQTLSDKFENTNYYVLRTLFNLPKSISYEQILLQYNLDSIKHRCLVQALTLVYKGYPNYMSNEFRIKNCAYNLCGNGSSQPPILVLNTDLFLILRAASGTIYLCMLGRPQTLRILWPN